MYLKHAREKKKFVNKNKNASERLDGIQIF
jgi:hypothetical protein